MKTRIGAMELIGFLMVLTLVVIAAAAPILAPHDPTRAVAPTYGEPAPPSLAFPFGTTCFRASSTAHGSR
jgi:ABC-type dipeptide/oligopeptide/nickel transport system permease subunit